jgi:SAM-dependent methyltransferase
VIAQWRDRLAGAMRRFVPASDGPYVGPRHAWRIEMVCRELRHVVPVGLVLDAGCGDGDLARALAASGDRVLALDRRLDRVRAARGRPGPGAAPGQPGNVCWMCADVTRLPFAAAAFAGVSFSEVLEHVPADRTAVDEAGRVLEPEGWLVATVPAGPERYGDIDRMVGHVRRYDRSGVLRLLGEGDFVPCVLRGWGFPFGRLYDRFAQRPALRARQSGAAPLVWWLARSRAIHALWRALFSVDERIDAGGQGSGWLIVARRRIAV